MTDIKTNILGIKNLLDEKKPEDVPLVDLLRVWMVITDLEIMDAMHLSVSELGEHLISIHEKLSGILDVVDEDQLQEAACRQIGKINIYGDFIQEGEVAERMKLTVSWDGGKWLYITDPKLRMTESCGNYKSAKNAIFEMLGRN